MDYSVIARQLGPTPQLELALAAYNAEGTIVNSVVDQTTEATLGASLDARGIKVYRLRQQIVVPADTTLLRVAMRDMSTDRVGSLEIPLPLAPERAPAQGQ